jgi:hypothetical protein
VIFNSIKIAKNIKDQPCHLVSISPIFYEQIFSTKVFCAPFMCLQFGFVIFWQKDFGAKTANKMLVKLTPVVGAKSSSSFFQNVYFTWVCRSWSSEQ